MDLQTILSALPASDLEELEKLLEAESLERPSFEEFCLKELPYAPDKWQLDLIRRLDAVKFQKKLRILIHAPPRVGKPVWDEERVLMGDGTTRKLKDVQVGDYVITHRGRPRVVTHVHIQGERECVEISALSGATITAALDHPFLTADDWVDAGALRPGMSLASLRGYSTIPQRQCRSNLEFELAGYFVGDGSCSSGNSNITSADPAQTERIIEIAHKLGFKANVYTKKGSCAKTIAISGGCRKWLRDVGLEGKNSFTKVVPDWVYTGSNEAIGLFVGAYFSCDGSVCKKHESAASLEFYSVSRELLTGVQQLLFRLGCNFRLRSKLGKYRGEAHGSFRLSATNQDALADFCKHVKIYGKKAAALSSMLAARKTFGSQYFENPVLDVRRIGTRPCRCLTVDEDSTFIAGDVVVHNSTILRLYAAYKLGLDPLARCKYVCYNIERSSEHSKAIRAIVQSHAFKILFPTTTFPRLMPSSAWYTNQRLSRKDAEPSFQPLGLVTGFVGVGASDLFIDDPYSDAKDAFSDVYNEAVRIFWQETTKPRILDGNVFVMFHRYSDKDFIAMLKEEGGWEEWRYCALADSEDDIIGREIGEPLTKRFGDVFFEEMRDSLPQSTWESQYQGRPSPLGGGMIRKEWFDVADSAPPMKPSFVRRSDDNEYIVRVVLGVDLAVSAKTSADFTVAFPIGISNKKRYYVFNPYRERLEWPDTRRNITNFAAKWNVGMVGVEANAQLLALADDLRKVSRRPMMKLKPLIDKAARARLWTPLAEAGAITLVEDGSGWTTTFLEEAGAFPNGKNDDQVDALGAGLTVASFQNPSENRMQPAYKIMK